MVQKWNWKNFSLFGIVVIFTVVLAACAGLQPAAAPASQAEATAAPTDTPAAQSAEITATTASTPTTAITSTTPTTPATSTTPTTTTQSSTGGAEVRVFTIDQSQSEARFSLNEELLGSPKTVVGKTSLVNGTIQLDLADPTKTVLSPLQIDARDFKTDSNMRNRAISRFILQTAKDEYRYIVFTPKSIEGLPKTAKAGDTFDLTINGDLTISGVTKPVTFATTVQAASDNELSGLAKTQVLRSDFNLQIPSVPSVANVTDAVQLELQFAAKAE